MRVKEKGVSIDKERCGKGGTKRESLELRGELWNAVI
jgi:hypothetical protein